MDADVDEFAPDIHMLKARMHGIVERLEGSWADALRAQLHLDRDSAESAYWHAGYVQALADILQIAAERCATYGSVDTATRSHAVC